MSSDGKKLRIIKLLYIINLIPLLPCFYATVAEVLYHFFEIYLPVWSRGFLGLTLPIIFLRIFYLPYIISAILNVVYLWYLIKEKSSAKEVILFAFLLSICILGLLSVENVFNAGMGI